MALKVKAVERLVRFNKNDAGKYLYVMQPELYIPLAQQKVIKEAALRSGVSQGVMQACWDAAGEVIKTVLIRHVRFFFAISHFFWQKVLQKSTKRSTFAQKLVVREISRLAVWV